MTDWRQKLVAEIRLMGHRNWIVIADAAYPLQSRSGISTIVTSTDHIDVVKAVLDDLDRAQHVDPIIYVDAELEYVSEERSPGVAVYRDELSRMLANRPVYHLPHEEIIEMLDKAGKMFQILVLKTDMMIPYTSVFCQLDCGYWNADAEKALRAAMAAAAARG